MSLMAELGEGPPPPNQGNDQNRFNATKRSPSSGNIFERQMAPRAIAAPPPTNQSLPTPPQLIPNNLPPPPWNQQQPNMSQMPNINQPPPPTQHSINIQPPWQTQVGPMPPPLPMLHVPPPTQNPQISQMTMPPLMPWMQSNVPPISQPPPPGVQGQAPPTTSIPPPNIPPWQQSVPPPQPPPVFWPQTYMNMVPPPQPVQPPQVDVSLPNLLSAPPPPPPT